MFGFGWSKGKIEQMEQKIHVLESAIRKLENKPIGMVYVNARSMDIPGDKITFPAEIISDGSGYLKCSHVWVNLYRDDIAESRGKEIKVFGRRYPKDSVIIYEDVYMERKKKIEAKYKKEA